MQSYQTLQQWISLIQDTGKGLSKWEEDFVSSVAEQLETRKSLSERQIEILERIYTEKTK